MFKKLFITTLGLLAVALTSGCSSASKPAATPSTARLQVEDELPPRAEPPYPGAEDGAFAADVSMVEIEKSVATTRPIKIDDEGVYYYGTDVARPTPRNHPEIAPPKDANRAGEFLYTADKTAPTPVGHPDIERPILTTSRGDYHYRLEENKATAGASFRLGTLSPPKLTNRDNGMTFAQLYSDTYLPMLLVDYEWRLFTSLGRLSLRFGSGFSMASGQGRFRYPHPSRDPAQMPVEKFTFVLFPNQLTAIYKLQFADRQILVPFIEGGGGYFTFSEIRDDVQNIKFGASPVAVVAGGANFLLDWLDPSAIRELDASYGINHLWLTAELRQIVGLRKDLDFSSTSINGGVLVEF